MPGAALGLLADAARHPTHSRVDLCGIYRADDDSEILQALLRSMRETVPRLDLPWPGHVCSAVDNLPPWNAQKLT